MMTSFTEVRYHYNICRPVARTFGRGVTFVSDASVCMHKHARLWHALLGKFQKWDALRLLLRPFWDRSKAVVATWLTTYCIQFLAVHVYICWASWHRISKIEGTKVGRTAGGVISLERQPSSIRNIYHCLFKASFLRSSVNSLHASSTGLPWTIDCLDSSCS